MDEDIRKKMQAKWEEAQAAASTTEVAQAVESAPPNESVPAAPSQPVLDADAVKAKQEAEYEEYKRLMAERYAKSAAKESAQPAPATSQGQAADAPVSVGDAPAPKTPRTAARELREQQDREFQEALAADQAAAGELPMSHNEQGRADSSGHTQPASQAEQEQELRRRQIAELRARSRSMEAPQTPSEASGMVRDEVTGDVRPAAAQGRVQRLTDDLPGVAPWGGFPGPLGGGFPGPMGGGAPARPELPEQLRQALTDSQLELLFEAMGEVGGGFPAMMGGSGFPGGLGMRSSPPPMAGFGGMGDMPGLGGMPGMRRGNPFGGFDDEEGTPSNWNPRNARQSETEQEIHRRQAAELRARARGEAPPTQPTGGTSTSAAAEGAAPSSGDGMVRDQVTGEVRPAAAQGRVERLTDMPGGMAGMRGPPGGFPGMGGMFGPPGGFPGLPGAGMGDDMPMTMREMALREQAMEGYGRPGRGGMPPWAMMGREPEGYEELSAISERIGDVSRGVPTATIEQNSFTFNYETPAPSSEIAVQAASDPTLARCPVCLCDLESGECCRRLPCLHMFHKGCIDDWLKRNRSCPVCKTDIVTGAQETRKEAGEQQCSAAAMPGEPDWQPPGWGEEEEMGPAMGMPGGYGLGPPRPRRQPGVGFGGPQAGAAPGAAAGAAPRSNDRHPSGRADAEQMGMARGYFDRGPRDVGGPFDGGPPPGTFGGDFGSGGGMGMPGYDFPPSLGGLEDIPRSMGGMRGMGAGGNTAAAAAAAAAARAAEARAASAAVLGDESPRSAGMVQDPVTGEMRPAAAQVSAIEGRIRFHITQESSIIDIGPGPDADILISLIFLPHHAGPSRAAGRRRRRRSLAWYARNGYEWLSGARSRHLSCKSPTWTSV